MLAVCVLFVRNDELLRCKACTVSKYCNRDCQVSNQFSMNWYICYACYSLFAPAIHHPYDRHMAR